MLEANLSTACVRSAVLATALLLGGCGLGQVPSFPLQDAEQSLRAFQDLETRVTVTTVPPVRKLRPRQHQPLGQKHREGAPERRVGQGQQGPCCL